MTGSIPDSEPTPEMNLIFNQCVISLNILIEASERGSSGAVECLRDSAERLECLGAMSERP